mgnify:CR=1 FL=1
MSQSTGMYDAPFLARGRANHMPLTPLTMLQRSAEVFPARTAVIDGRRRFTWAETYARCRRLASALAQAGVGRGDTVAVMAPNVTALYEAHFGVPMAGAVLNALNTRLDPATIGFILEHGEARVLIADREYAPVVAKAIAGLARRCWSRSPTPTRRPRRRMPPASPRPTTRPSSPPATRNSTG